MKITHTFAALALGLAFAASASAQSIPAHIDAANILGVGNDGTVGTTFDHLNFAANDFAVSFGTFDITGVTFEAGPSASVAPGTTLSGTFDLVFSAPAAGIGAQTVTFSYGNLLGADTDTVTVAASSSDFVIGGTSYTFSTNQLVLSSSGPLTAGELTGSLAITAAVPEPETYALMGAGLMGLIFVAKRRKA